MEGNGSPPSPACHVVRAYEIFPKPSLQTEDDKIKIPLNELAGEFFRYMGRTDDGVLTLSNYRLIIVFQTVTTYDLSVPLGLIESVVVRDLFHLVINCKDASTVKCSFTTSERCTEWQRRIALSIGTPANLESLFAFPFCAWAKENQSRTVADNICQSQPSRYDEDFRREVKRLEFDVNGTWRISHANEDFKLCPSYPRLLLVPCCISDETLKDVASFRSSRRIPAVVWRHKQSGAVIARCSQPEVGWLGWRNSRDEQLLKALADACAFDRGEQRRRQDLSVPSSDSSCPSSPEGSHEEVCLDEVRKILIVDARSYTSAVTNRARGGGCECAEYYPCAEIQFMSLGNIHVIRKSFHALRQLCASSPDIPNWLGMLERTMWLQHLSGLLAASMTVCHAIERKGRPVLVHCSDGWDRTPQIVATALLCLDPFYRTVEGFRILVEREWLSYGHKFSDRCGNGPGSEDFNERCPVFLQWLDCVYQIHQQFTCSFEFSTGYLIKLAQHSHSCLFGTFLCNTLKERIENTVFDRTYSVWPFLSGPIYKNPLYVPNRDRVLWPAHNVRDLVLWSEVYLGNLGNQYPAECPTTANEATQESKSPLIKTRSYGDLMQAGGNYGNLTRRSSDPNMAAESHIESHLHLTSDTMSDCGDIRNDQAIVDYCIDTIQRVDNLTEELRQCDLDGQLDSALKIFDMPSTVDGMNGDNDQAMIGNMNHRFNGLFYEKDSNNVRILENGIGDRRDLSSITNGSCIDECDGEQKSDRNSDSDMMGNDIQAAFTLQNDDAFDTSPLNDSPTQQSGTPQTLWHGSVDTSTDTLVPVEQQQQQPQPLNGSNDISDSITTTVDKNGQLEECDNKLIDINKYLLDYKSAMVKSSSVQSRQSKIVPEVHGNVGGVIDGKFNNRSAMDESIIIQPEHQRMDFISGVRYENGHSSIVKSHRRRRNSTNSKTADISPNKYINGSISPSATNSRFSTPAGRSLPLTPPTDRQYSSVAISCPDGLAHALSEQNLRLQQIVFEHKQREQALQRDLHAARLALFNMNSCNNCTCAAQSQEDADEYITKMLNDVLNVSPNEQSIDKCFETFHHSTTYRSRSYSASSLADNAENVSVCSWEAVEDRSAPSSGASSTVQGSNVLWVPDHAVNRCTTCHNEFWMGRRRHHCRSCGHIFCADCSEFWAPLPDERLYNPVRLCSPCYVSVTNKLQLQQQTRLNNSQSQHLISGNGNHQQTKIQVLTKPSNCHQQYQQHPSTHQIDPCKHGISVGSLPNNERDILKATTATN